MPDTSPPARSRLARILARPLAGIPVPLGLLFAIDGFVRASGIVRVPDYKKHVGADAGMFGLALLCSSLGALVGMPIAGRLCDRFGTHQVLTVGSIAACGVILLPAASGSMPALAVSFFIFGAIYGGAEVGLNSAAVEIETATGATIMSPLRGLFSCGELGGSLLGALFAVYVSPVIHLAVIGTAAAVVIVLLATRLVRDGAVLRADLARIVATRPVQPESRRLAGGLVSHRQLVVLGLGLIALSTAYGEGSIGDWGSIHLHEGLGVSVAVAAFGYAAFSLAITVARLVGAPLLRRIGALRLVVGGSLLAAGGILLAAWTSLPTLAVLGYVAVGLGLANVFPIAIARAGAVGGSRGVATSSTLALFGMLIGPALIGFIADHASLPTGMSTVAVLAMVAVCLSGLLRSPPDDAGARRDAAVSADAAAAVPPLG